MNKTLMFIVNPRAGRTRTTAPLFEAVARFSDAGYLVSVRQTASRGDATRFVLENGGDFDRIVCYGGDGTLNEVVTGAMQLSAPPPIGYIPGGSTNDFAASLHLSDNPPVAALRINSSVGKTLDVGTFNGRPFVYVAAFGAFTEVSYQTPQQLKMSLGRTAYIFEGIKSLSTIRPWRLKMKHDGGTVESQFLYGMISNTRRVGGFDLRMKQDISISDGLMEVILVENPHTPVDNAKMLGAVLAQDTSSKYITFAHTRKITFEADEPLPWTVDGDNGGSVSQGKVEIIEHGIELFF